MGMKRRDFLGYAGLAATSAVGGSLLTGCSSDEPEVKFWQQGNFRPVTEEVTVTDLKVEGAIPPELSGLYVRNGTNTSTGVADHFFGGDGMLHGVRLEGGKALWYRNRYVNTPAYRQESSGFSPPGGENNTSAVSLIHHGGKLMSLGEFGYPYLINPADLSTEGAYTYNGKLTGNMTAHPRIDPDTGELLFFGYNVMAPYLTYMRADAAGNLVQIEPITLTGPSMMHDFAATRRYVVFMEMPVRFSWLAAVSGSALPFKWDADAPCRVGVMPRTGSDADVRWFDIPPCFVFHIMNSFERGDDEVIVDAARYDHLWVKNSHDFFHPARLSRFTMNLRTGQASVEEIHGRAMEFPQVNRALWTRPYRYGYSLVVDEENDSPARIEQAQGGIRKYDLQTGEVENYLPGPALTPGEALFIPAAGSRSEDEGYLASFIYDKNTQTSAFCLFDATRISAGPIATVALPVRVPVGFHGLWLPDSALG